MSRTIPEDAQRLATRLRMLADEIESAARHGITIPHCVAASGHRFGTASFSATEQEFAEWAEYTEADVEGYVDQDGARWSSATADVNGLPLSFAVRHEAAAVSA